MDQRISPSARIEPLPPEDSPELKDQFESMRKNLGFIPNSILIMQRKPKMAKALAQMTASIWDPEGKVDRGLRRLIAHVASRTAGCQYCMAHTAGGALHFGVEDKKLAAVWDYQSSPLFSAAAIGCRSIGTEYRHRRNVFSTPRALERRADCRNCRRDCHVRLSQPVERHAGYTAGRRADSCRPKVSRATRLVSRETQ